MLDLYVNIKNRRKELGMTQTELAVKTGYTNKSSIATIESGRIDLPLSKINEFAAALDCTPGFLMGWEDTAATSDSSDLMEKTLVTNYRKLSDDGRKDLVKRSDELVQLESLRKESRLGKDA